MLIRRTLPHEDASGWYFLCACLTNPKTEFNSQLHNRNLLVWNHVQFLYFADFSSISNMISRVDRAICKKKCPSVFASKIERSCQETYDISSVVPMTIGRHNWICQLQRESVRVAMVRDEISKLYTQFLERNKPYWICNTSCRQLLVKCRYLLQNINTNTSDMSGTFLGRLNNKLSTWFHILNQQKLSADTCLLTWLYNK